jgi:hypothetical protein
MKFKYNINGMTFKTDKSVQEYAKSILYFGAVNSILTETEFSFMYSYFESIHHEWKLKLGNGIKSIHRVLDKVSGKYRSFEIERVDGSVTDISYIVQNIKSPNLKNDFKKALRYVVMPQILDFKTGFFQFPITKFCDVTGDIITFSNCHIDHYNPTFDELVNDFIHENNLTNFAKILEPSKDNQTIAKLSDENISKLFFDYHLKNANLRVVSIKANLSILKTK